VQTNSAFFHALVEPHGSDVTFCHFDYGTTTEYLLPPAPCEPPYISGLSTAVEVSAFVSGLQPNTTYHMRAFALSEGGPAIGPDQTFTTGSPATPTPAPAPSPTPPPTQALTPTPSPAAAYCVAPNLKGRTLSRAKTLLASANCKLGKIRRRRARHGKLVVTAQSLPAGTRTSAGAAINLILGSRR
jgi:hypothetical protein